MSNSTHCTIVSPYSDQRGGAELSLLHALEYGSRYGIDWSLAVPKEGAISRLARELEIPTTSYGESRMRSPRGYLTAVHRISKLVRQNRSDLLLAWDAFEHFRVAAVSALTGVPAVWFQKGGVVDNRRNRWQSRLPARAIFANSLFTAKRQQALLQNLGKSRPIYVVPSAVNLSEFDAMISSPEDCRAELELPVAGPLIVLVGRLQRWKGFHVLIDALAIVKRYYADATAILVGGKHDTEPNYSAELSTQATRLGIQDSIVQTGFVPHENIVKYMQAADVVVHASVDEPFGIVVIEALALGKPVVAASAGGPADVITDGMNGLLADPGSPEDLAAKLLQILDDSSSAHSLGERGKLRARDFSVEQFASRLSESIKDCVERKHSHGIIADPALTKTSHPLIEVGVS